MIRTAAVTATAFAALALPAVAAAPLHITPKRVGHVKLGVKQTVLHNAGLVGPITKGCELDPGSRGALLSPPLEGAVDLSKGKQHKVRAILVNGGATARGVGIGDKKAAIVKAFPKAVFDDSSKKLFGVIVRIPKGAGGPMEMQLGKRGGVQIIAIPHLVFCE